MWYVTRRYILAWAPVLVAAAIMFVASAQPKLGPPDGVDPLTLYFSGMLPVFPGLWEPLIKKSAHLLAFGVFALLALRALLACGCPLRSAAYLAIVCAVAYAFIDELHQSFVPGRIASGVDIGIDFIGATLFTLFARRAIRRAGAAAPLPAAATQS